MEYLKDLLTQESVKSLFTAATVATGLFVFFKGVVEFVRSNAMRRYEKFQQMSERFDKTEGIQRVCNLLHGVSNSTDPATSQDKEVFICFMEEIYFMVNSKIMKKRLALYTFGYYAGKAGDSEQFWQGLDRNKPFYVHFREFCLRAKTYTPNQFLKGRKLSY